MGAIGVAALIANGGVALMLYRFRMGDANMRSVWICSRNDALGNLAVMLAAMGVLGTGTGWPDVIVAAIMGGLGLWGGWQMPSVRHAGSFHLNAPRPPMYRRSKVFGGRFGVAPSHKPFLLNRALWAIELSVDMLKMPVTL